MFLSICYYLYNPHIYWAQYSCLEIALRCSYKKCTPSMWLQCVPCLIKLCTNAYSVLLLGFKNGLISHFQHVASEIKFLPVWIFIKMVQRINVRFKPSKTAWHICHYDVIIMTKSSSEVLCHFCKVRVLAAFLK